ncbi:MAG: ubiquinol-cytochrome c reductase iron-sulfur subunit [Gemmatimonas sp.]
MSAATVFGMRSCTRRSFVIGSAAALGSLCGCASTETEPEPAPQDSDGVVVTLATVHIDLTRATALSKIGGALVVPDAAMMIIHANADDYRALSNICTHSGCGIYVFLEGRMRCQCHGSEFDVDGTNVAGPAPLPLPRYALERAGTMLTISRTRSA